jgi:cardiolipin synthase A/B
MRSRSRRAARELPLEGGAGGPSRRAPAGISSPLVRLALLAALIALAAACATLPRASEKIEQAPRAAGPPQVASSRGLLPPATSRAILDRLRRMVAPTDLLGRYITVMEAISKEPLTKGNKVTLLVDGPATYAAMFHAIEDARANVNLETFIFEDDATGRKFAELLLRKRAAGVEVNLIVDSVGSFATGDAFFRNLRKGGIRVVEFNDTNPLKARRRWDPIHRDHRKVLIVDGKLAIIGGVNISHVYSTGVSGASRRRRGAPLPWRDTDVEIEGPAVAEFQQLFLDTWSKQKGPALAQKEYFPRLRDEGDALVRAVGSTPGENNRRNFVAYVAAFTFAEHSIHLTNAYFVPDRQVLEALTDAAQRGVDVEIVVPSTTDARLALDAQRDTYSGLLKAGVKIFERHGALMHAKTAVLDGVWSTVGSTNMDYWSFLSNDEVNAIILSRSFAVDMEKLFALDVAASEQIRWQAWKHRSLAERIRELIGHLFLRWL